MLMISTKSQRHGDILQVHWEQFSEWSFGGGGKKGGGALKSVIFVKCVVTAAVRNITRLTRWQSPAPTCVINAVEAHDYTWDLAGGGLGLGGWREVKKGSARSPQSSVFHCVLHPGALPLIFRQRLIRLTGNEWKRHCLMLANPLKSLASY